MLQTGAPTFHSLLELPTPVAASSSVSARVAEYPDAIALSPTRWCVSDGTGRIYLVAVDKSVASAWTARIEASFELAAEEGEELLPFRLHSVDEVAEKGIFALLSIPIKVAPSALPTATGGFSASARHKIPSTTAFEYLSVRFDVPAPVEGEDAPMEDVAAQKLVVQWRLHSHDLPSFVTFDAQAERYIIGAPSSLTSNPEGPSTPTAPTRPSSTTPGASTPEPSSSSAVPIPRPPPFSWTQDSDSLTVVFPLPSDTPTSSIRITFSRLFLTLHVGSAAAALSSASAPSSLPHVSHKKLWDTIDPHTSVWTFDREAEGRDSTFGLLSLHLEKGNPGTKWSDVFALTPESMVEDVGVSRIQEVSVEEEERELEHVTETLDPSELAKISESMEQWTKGVAEQAGGEVDGDGLGHGVPTSLIGEEIDVEVDGDSGRPLIVTWIEAATTSTPRLVRPHPTIPYSLLSTPLPLASATSPDPTITIKHDVDGLLFTPSSSASTYTWTHTSTFPALAFVLATKQDATFVHHLSNRAVLAFDAPSSFTLASPAGGTRSGAGNLFVYCRTEEVKGAKGVQMVLRVGGPSSGAMVGVGGVVSGQGKVVVVALCEKELVVFKVL